MAKRADIPRTLDSKLLREMWYDIRLCHGIERRPLFCILYGELWKNLNVVVISQLLIFLSENKMSHMKKTSFNNDNEQINEKSIWKKTQYIF